LEWLRVWNVEQLGLRVVRTIAILLYRPANILHC
jgi:hypothetical protein